MGIGIYLGNISWIGVGHFVITSTNNNYIQQCKCSIATSSLYTLILTGRCIIWMDTRSVMARRAISRTIDNVGRLVKLVIHWKETVTS